jgi:uncharacterized glyoxalase superfamily protein PhnB
MTANNKPQVSPVLRYADGPAAIDWLVKAFGFEKHSDFRTPQGAVAHADLRFGPSAIGVSSASVSEPDSPWSQVRQGIYVSVANPDACYEQARAAGAEIVVPIRDMDYGSRDFSLRDPEGHLWGFGTYDMGAAAGDPAIWSEACYRNPDAAVDWIERTLGFSRTLTVPDERGALIHAELKLGPGVCMVAPRPASTDEWGDIQVLVHLRVEDPDTHFGRARAAGATVVREPQTTPYGARFYAVRDPEGFAWWISNYTPAAGA